MQSQQAMQLLAEMNGKTIDSMAAEIERLRQREELTAKERDELKELADAAKEAADASSKEAGEIGDLSRRRSKLERLEALNKASGASSGAVGAKSKPLKKVARDEGVDLKELEEVAQAVEDAADSSASQSKVETDLDTDTAALVTTMKALTRVSKATADSQSSAADRLTEAELAKKLAAAAKKSADDAKSKTDGLGTEVDKRKRLSKIAKKSDAARKSSSGVKIEVDRKREPKPDAEKTKKRIKGLKDATESNALAAIDEVKSLKEGSSDPTLGPELLRALTDASKGAADTADEDARYLLELLGEVNSTVQELTEASKAFADASAALAAAEATPSPTTLTKLGRLLDGSLASGLAATVEAERIARGGLTAPSPSISNVTRSAGAAQGVTDAVAAEVQRLRAEALGPLSAALLGAAVTAGVAATDSTVAEVGRLLWQSPWHGSGLRQRALAAQAAMRDVAKKAARFASGQGDTNANLAALDQAVRVAQTAGLAMTDEAVEMTVGSGSVGTSPANVGALLAATRAAVLSNTVESDRAADTGTSPSFGTASRLKAAADAAKTSSAALSAEAERMATALASNRGKALRLTSLAGSARQIGLELVAAAAPLGGGGGLPPATLQQIAELAGEGHVVVAVAGSEANQLEERDLSLAPPRRPRPRGW
jgi:hypothetical protein